LQQKGLSTLEFCEALLVVASEVQVPEEFQYVYETLASKLKYTYETCLMRMTAKDSAPWNVIISCGNIPSHDWKQCLVKYKEPLRMNFEFYTTVGSGHINIQYSELLVWLQTCSVIGNSLMERDLQLSWQRTQDGNLEVECDSSDLKEERRYFRSGHTLVGNQ
jgi:hypothetical protein